VEILYRFQMLDCKPLATPMIPNLKLHADLDSDLIDPSLYTQLIGSLMYCVNTILDICFAVNTLSQFMVVSRHIHWKVAKHAFQFSKDTVHYGVWTEVCGRW